MEKVKIGKTHVNNVTLEESVGVIEQMIAKDEKTYVVTPNVDHIVKLETDEEFLRVYQGAGLVLPDGNPLVWASRFLGTPLKERVTGSDLFPALCENASKHNHSVFFLGGLEGVAQKAAENLMKKHPNLNVVGVYCPPFGFDKNKEENDKIVAMINEVKPDILFVGVGAPKQEKWIYRNINQLHIKVAIGIGASFDFEAGTIKRASKAYRNAGLEWFWRFANEPRRLFRRYFIDSARFIPIIYKQARSSKGRT
jgi:N-acetylglucosaminyldiphosphoundecaprenol N-acetyl-beta-D-mannosaminyltransferase